MKKKWCSFLLCICMLCAALPAFAADDRAVFDITSLGIMEGNGSGDMALNETMTRAEFAKALTKLLNISEVASTAGVEQRFSDVKTADWFAPYVNSVAATGYMDGDPDGKFRPQAPVLGQEAVKALVSVLGYGNRAAQQGGYPAGYFGVAATLKLLRGVKGALDAPATRGDVLMLLYNSLDVDIMEPAYDGTFEVKKGDTFRARLSDSNQTYHIRGVVTADNTTYLLLPNTGISPGDLEIGGIVYRSAGAATEPFVGMEVEIFYYEDENTGDYHIKNIAATTKNDVVEFDADDLAGVTGSTVSYYPEGQASRSEKLPLAEDYKIVYNNRVLPDSSKEDLLIDSGSYRLIDNDGDGAYEFVFLAAEENVVVDRVFESGEIYFKNTFTLGGERYISVEPEETQTYRVKKQDGSAAELSEIEPDDVLSVMRSKDKEYVTLVIGMPAEDGTILEITDDEVLIGETWHDLANPALSLRVGDSYKLYYNYRGALVYTQDGNTESSGKLYGYIAEAASGAGMGEPSVMMLTAGKVTSREEENKENVDDKNKIPVLYCSNSSVQELKLRDKISVDGKSYGAREYLNEKGPGIKGPVLYTLSDGKVKSIETPERAGGLPGQNIIYSAKEKVFGGYESYGGFSIDEHTRVVCVPEGGAQKKEDYSVEIKIDNRDAEQKYNAQGYLLDPVTKNVKFLVVTRPMDADSVSSISYKSSSVAMVVQFAQTVNPQDENGDSIYKITLLDNSGKKDYLTTALNENNKTLRALRAGDMIYYELDTQERIQNAQKIVNAKELDTPGVWNVATEKECMYGLAAELKVGEIDIAGVRKVDRLQLDTGLAGQEILISSRVKPITFLYDKGTDEYSTTVQSAIREGFDHVYILQPYGSVKALLVIR